MTGLRLALFIIFFPFFPVAVAADWLPGNDTSIPLEVSLTLTSGKQSSSLALLRLVLLPPPKYRFPMEIFVLELFPRSFKTSCWGNWGRCAVDFALLLLLVRE